MVKATAPLARDAEHVSTLLDSPEIAGLIADLDATRWTGRPGYPVSAMVGLALVKSLYALPTWTRTVALVRDHAALRDVVGAHATYRFAAKLRKHGAGPPAVDRASPKIAVASCTWDARCDLVPHCHREISPGSQCPAVALLPRGECVRALFLVPRRSVCAQSLRAASGTRDRAR